MQTKGFQGLMSSCKCFFFHILLWLCKQARGIKLLGYSLSYRRPFLKFMLCKKKKNTNKKRKQLVHRSCVLLFIYLLKTKKHSFVLEEPIVRIRYTVMPVCLAIKSPVEGAREVKIAGLHTMPLKSKDGIQYSMFEKWGLCHMPQREYQKSHKVKSSKLNGFVCCVTAVN